jgi:hypothetical protein
MDKIPVIIYYKVFKNTLPGFITSAKPGKLNHDFTA